MEGSFGLVSSSRVAICSVCRTPNHRNQKPFLKKPATRFFSCVKRESCPRETTAERAMGLNRLEEEYVMRYKFPRTLLVDNYDSYTYNIYQQLSVVNGVPPVVVYNDEWTWEYLYHYLYEQRCFDNIVISPGPGSPMRPTDIGLCLRILLECKEFPILGVCLGHQALGYVHGAQVVHAPQPVHGRLSEIEHNGCSLFHGIPSGCNSGFKVVRYHSLVIDPASLPKELIPIAWTCSADTLSFLDSKELHPIPDAVEVLSNGFVSIDHLKGNLKNGSLCYPKNLEDSKIGRVLMGIMHSSRPHYGVQFHPESIATCHGQKIFENFKKMTVDYWLRSSRKNERKVSQVYGHLQNTLKSRPLRFDAAMRNHLHTCEKVLNACKSMNARYLKLQWKKLDGLASKVGGSRNIFCELFGSDNTEDTFWLDSSSLDKRRARFSFMGGKGGLLWKQISFHLLDQRGGGYLSTRDAQGSMERTFLEDGFFDFMDKELQSFHYEREDYEGLPFDFCGGYIGFIGYDLKVECGVPSNLYKSKTPDACFFFADNLLVVDHTNGDVYILQINNVDHHENTKAGWHENTRSWLDKTEERLLGLEAQATKQVEVQNSQTMESVMSNFEFVVGKTKHQYIEDVEKCLKYIEDGESYELCLTTQMRKSISNKDFLKLYLNLRDQNPAPYAAWLNFSKENLCICCSSPERFLRLDGDGILEAKPIKGTIRRGKTPKEDRKLRFQLLHSEKDQAENLMIVDLLRNDLGRVCDPGSVHVPRLMEVESYATVHTLVSTIQGKKRSNLSPIDCVKAAFPGGSMTGAPKLRSMELLDSIEGCSRGIYSGSIGFFSYNQTFDLNIVIRTVIIHEGEASIGAGGAIVALSNPQDEHQEMLLKAMAPAKTLMEYETSYKRQESGMAA